MSEAMVDMDGTYHVWKTKSLPCYMQQVSEYFKHDRSQMDPCDALSLVHQTLTCTAKLVGQTSTVASIVNLARPTFCPAALTQYRLVTDKTDTEPKKLVKKEVCVQPRELSCKHGTARIRC